MENKFSIIVVCLNAKEKLKNTLDSIAKENYKNYQVIVKDGGSDDGSLDCINDYKDMDIIVEKSPDKGIYDAMNQAVSLSSGDYIFFLNTGDYFNNEDVLLTVNERINFLKNTNEETKRALIVYGNILDRSVNKEVKSNPKIDGFACYRNVPCHQACFYDRELLVEHPFDISYKVRADYEQFLWCFYKANAKTSYVDNIIADYEGGGYSAVNIKISKEEHKVITKEYMSPKELLKYKLILALTLSPLRTKMANSKLTAGFYNKVKSIIYRMKK